jgi:hypothetical protein
MSGQKGHRGGKIISKTNGKVSSFSSDKRVHQSYFSCSLLLNTILAFNGIILRINLPHSMKISPEQGEKLIKHCKNKHK